MAGDGDTRGGEGEGEVTESQWLAEKNNLQAQVDALEAARLQYRASMARFERLGRGCVKWRKTSPRYNTDHRQLEAFIDEWLAGEPKDVKEAREGT